MTKTTTCVTLTGIPLAIELEWPFHPSGSGADFHVLHGDVTLLDGRGLHALVAIQLTQVVKEALPSLDAEHTEAAAINTLRKETDIRQLEFLKSPKRLPVTLSSRQWDMKRQRFRFHDADDAAIADFLGRKVYWLSAGTEHSGASVAIADPCDAQYLGTTVEHLREVAEKAAGDGSLRLEGDQASATDKLLAQAEQFRDHMKRAVEEMEKKHEFERG